MKNNLKVSLMELLKHTSENKKNIQSDIPALNRSGKLKALIVDDVPVNRMVTRQILKFSFDCTEAENGEEAVHYFTTEQPDLILMDISMPVMNGVEALKRIRQLHTSDTPIPIIAVTSGGSIGSRENLLKQGFSEYIKKPVTPKELFEKIASFLPVHNAS